MNRPGERGMALLVVLSAIAFLLPLVYSGVEMGRFHQRRAENELALQEARRLAESVLSQVVAVLIEDAGDGAKVDHLGEKWAEGLPILFVDGGQLSVRVVDGTRTWNVNGLVQGKTTNAALVKSFAELLRRLEIDDGLMMALIDWLDGDDEARAFGGAETDWYRSAGKPYGPTNGPFRELAELLLVRGWDRTLLRRIRPHVGTGAGCDGAGINVNTASAETLAPLDRSLDVTGLIEMRREAPFLNVAALSEAGLIEDEAIKPLLRFDSGCFEAVIRSRVGPVTGVLTVWLERKGKTVTVKRVWWSG